MSLGVVLQVAGQLFGVTVEAADGKAPVWNSDVRFFCIKQDGKPRAYFFFVSIYQESSSLAFMSFSTASCTS